MYRAGAAQLMEHAAATDRLQLAWITDQYEAPLMVLGEGDEAVQRAGADHAGLIDQHRRPCPQPIAVGRWPVRA